MKNSSSKVQTNYGAQCDASAAQAPWARSRLAPMHTAIQLAGNTNRARNETPHGSQTTRKAGRTQSGERERVAHTKHRQGGAVGRQSSCSQAPCIQAAACVSACGSSSSGTSCRPSDRKPQPQQNLNLAGGHPPKQASCAYPSVTPAAAVIPAAPVSAVVVIAPPAACPRQKERTAQHARTRMRTALRQRHLLAPEAPRGGGRSS